MITLKQSVGSLFSAGVDDILSDQLLSIRRQLVFNKYGGVTGMWVCKGTICGNWHKCLDCIYYIKRNILYVKHNIKHFLTSISLPASSSTEKRNCVKIQSKATTIHRTWPTGIPVCPLAPRQQLDWVENAQKKRVQSDVLADFGSWCTLVFIYLFLISSVFHFTLYYQHCVKLSKLWFKDFGPKVL